MTGKQFQVRGSTGFQCTMEILGERPDAYEIRLSTSSAFGSEQHQDTITRELLETCLRTGYLRPLRTRTVA